MLVTTSAHFSKAPPALIHHLYRVHHAVAACSQSGAWEVAQLTGFAECTFLAARAAELRNSADQWLVFPCGVSSFALIAYSHCGPKQALMTLWSFGCSASQYTVRKAWLVLMVVALIALEGWKA